jgi:multiple sugar transport system substrate-binding protein
MSSFTISRRTVLQGMATSLTAIAASSVMTSHASSQGAFDWKKFSGSTIDVVLVKKPANEIIIANLKEFEELTGIKVSAELMPEQQHRQKLVIEFGSNNPSFDVTELSLNVQKRIAGKGKWFADLNPMLKDSALTSPDFDFADFAPGAVEFATQRDGRMDTLPYGLDYFLLYYNKEIFEAKGVALPKTMDEMAAAAQALHDPSKGIAGFVARGLKNANVPVWMNLIYGWGVDPIDADGNLQTMSDAAVQSATLYQKLLKDTGPVGVAGFNFAECQTTFSQGFAAMWLDSTAWARPLENPQSSRIAGKVGYMTVPKGPKAAASAIFASSLGIPEASTRKQAAWLFLQWFASKQNQTRVLQSGTGSSARRSPFADPATISSSPLPKAYFDVLAECVEIGRPGLPNIVPVTEFRDVYGVALTNMITGSDPATELQKATEAFKPILEASEK